MDDEDVLLAEIEQFLAESGMGAVYFGQSAAKNPRLVERLRARGMTPARKKKITVTYATGRRVRDFISEWHARHRVPATTS